ncbi:hypothetical protein [Rugosimonospora africana]|uniref:Uncharacterized protein n=1 Tax=Rugosimonospora africana TaxID=556532 RepID=A0A8J3QXD2_9ACTN|nr:hypothetical protein [Rugosimonospora africana]GIH18059.1 hypothetical protein Raf01_62310 [Rugosimonospora africana]
MRRKGVLYDVGRVLGTDWRPDYRPDLVRRELAIIAADLHCTAVRICGRDLDRLEHAASVALDLGMEVWFSPELWGRKAGPTLAYLATAAEAAQRLRRRAPGGVVFSVGSELSLFMRGLLPGRTLQRRIRYALSQPHVGRQSGPLNAFLASAVSVVRRVFGGPVTYSSLDFERVDWTPFDIVGVDHYWHKLIADRYALTLRPWLATGKPVVVTEFGFRTRTGADQTGGAGPENVAMTSALLYFTPGLRHLMMSAPTEPAGALRRLVLPRVRTVHERNEAHQADSLVRQLTVLDDAGVDGAFVQTFVTPLNLHHPHPRHDLDTDCFALVKSLPRGRRGTTYPDLAWEPKRSFTAVADFYATH